MSLSKADQRYAKLERIRIILGILGEIKNYRAYMNGSMGELVEDQKTNVNDRITNVLASASKKGVEIDYFLDLVVEEGEFPELEYSRLVQLAVIAEANWKMRLAIGKDKGIFDKPFTFKEIEHVIGVYTDACRSLRKRYYLVEIKKLLPALNLSGSYSR